ncbi:Glutamate/Leucine/Phenylalanine/Valine dehydrogenase-domain-containing protein [Radiomyces spectabilis]|uniref:Glutamate/Leucine/Phenylalanine/Valine dehydrogenase-domain-containing protein n=1 Tax=Radiomyces spectabilis TaxID=64574 RepID=UPI0022208714|nr:Glutamate/Leucine/Phenylalanine/Valine dehydrogenase-domain-containing protein [Radiomyces spectabilis]KAI8377565.1 Glutamate/Leucine/Phenylalanine/Valine dehydrogenase-domain-containing protein [Radiomyces spectabilis]
MASSVSTLPAQDASILSDKYHTIVNESGYNTNVFAGKNEQMGQVCKYLENLGFLPKDLVENEVQWFYGNLNIDDYYFALESVETIANHIMALYGAKILAFTKHENVLDVNLQKESEDSSVFIHSSQPGVSQVHGPQNERRIDEKYLDISTPAKAYRVESYRSSGMTTSGMSSQLRSYFVTKCQFANPEPTPEQEMDIRQVADQAFLKKATDHTLKIYSEVMHNVLQRTGPVIEMFEVQGSRERRLIIGYRQRSTKGFFSAMSDLYHYYDLYSTRKYVEQFSNGVTIICLYLNPVPNSKATPIEHSIYQVMKETSLIFCLPKTPLQNFFQTNKLSVQETIYGYVGWIFAQHFLNRLGKEYLSLNNILDASNPIHEEILSKMKKRLRQDTFTRDYILDIIRSYPDLIRLLYANFATVHYVNQREASLQPTISYQRLTKLEILSNEELSKKIKAVTSNAHEQLVFESFLTFNKHVVKTNFYQSTKVALSFRLDPSFLPEIEYPNKLYGMFLVVGAEFRGFHLRFRDVARGGIRIIRSRNREAYSINQRTLFDENYALAATQQRKNKDIPEGGSKGTILLDIDQQDKPRVAFEKYVDSVLDLLITGETPGIKEKLVDLADKQEILFFGPDEGTADYMDWASLHARRRGAGFWKAFTTGKSQSMGGIPHDTYGMTTRSVHQYVLGIYRTFGLKEEECTKLQTGGPDGDLGSNEIKISKDKTVAIVDGSGVLCDPHGINRDELLRLATKRMMISNFDTSKLSADGFRVLVDESNVRLPDGTVVENGLSFRNTFHTNKLASAMVFVPCGGRPESVDLSNIHKLMGEDGSLLFKYIVEGANLFFTQEARLRLEKAGVVIFKDASANKGGVTSSSLEVLAALAFNDAEFDQHMSVKNGVVPEFYEAYVKEVQRIIEHNAAVEFDALWREHTKTKQPISVLSDELSTAIVQLNEQLQNTGLWDNVALRRSVLERAFPKLLLDKIGLDTLLQRVPESYVKAIFGAYLASQFVYKYGAQPDHFAFFEFMRENYYSQADNVTNSL